ncbi:MAG: MGMT family protein [Sandaracinaceae bacterium]|nr:MGMT family protein [Myxococcales bacterium]MCB9662304.1 MGMT family protein [Sandaracinaceae bacterium]
MSKRRHEVPTGAAEYPSYYDVVRQIPKGKVLTYGDVARLAGRPGSARRVGYALAALTDPTVPWWRVVNARGEVSERSGDFLGAAQVEQRVCLAREGIVFDAQGRLALGTYRAGAW